MNKYWLYSRGICSMGQHGHPNNIDTWTPINFFNDISVDKIETTLL